MLNTFKENAGVFLVIIAIFTIAIGISFVGLTGQAPDVSTGDDGIEAAGSQNSTTDTDSSSGSDDVPVDSAIWWNENGDASNSDVSFYAVVDRDNSTNATVRWILRENQDTGEETNVSAYVTTSTGEPAVDENGNNVTVFESPDFNKNTISEIENPELVVHVEMDSQLQVYSAPLTNESGEVFGDGVDRQGLELSHEDTDSYSYGPDYGIPSNSFRVFYADDEEDDPEEEFDEPDPDEIDQDVLGSPRSISDIDDDEDDVAGDWARFNDMEFYTASGVVEFYGWTLGNYRANQIINAPVDSDDSKVLDGYEDARHDDGVIKDAYVAFTGVNNGVEPLFELSNDDWADAFAGRNGEVMTFLDYRLEQDELPEDELEDPVTFHSTASTPHWGSGKTHQEQTRWTNHIENVYVERTGEMTEHMRSHSRTTDLGTEYGPSGAVFPYSGIQSVSAAFDVAGEVEAHIYEYEEMRTRDRHYNSRDVSVSVSGSDYVTASRSTTRTVYGSGVQCTRASSTVHGVSASTTESTTNTYNWETDVTRTFEYTMSTTTSVDVSGWGCTYVGQNETSGTVDITMTGGKRVPLSTTEIETINYEWWGSWSNWEILNKDHVRTDYVEMDDDLDVATTDNNRVNVEQTVIEVAPDHYHSHVEIEYVDHFGQPLHTGHAFDADDLNRYYLWSMMMYGDETFIETDWKMYSAQEWSEANVYDEDGDEVESIPNILNVYLYSETNGPVMNARGQTNQRNAEIDGWSGDFADGMEDYETGENVQLDAGIPIVYTEFMAKDVPSPATSMVSVFGTEREIRDHENEKIPYAEPDVNIRYHEDTDTVRVEVLDVDGDGMSGRDVAITAGQNDLGTHTTNRNGVAIADAEDFGIGHIHANVDGDNWEEVLDEDGEVFYGSVSAQKTIGTSGINVYLYQMIQQLLFAIPLILLYLLWRDGRLGM